MKPYTSTSKFADELIHSVRKAQRILIEMRAQENGVLILLKDGKFREIAAKDLLKETRIEKSGM